MVDLIGLPADKVCDDYGEPVAWSTDGNGILYVYGQPRPVGLFRIASGQKTQLLHHSRYSLEQASSPRMEPGLASWRTPNRTAPGCS